MRWRVTTADERIERVGCMVRRFILFIYSFITQRMKRNKEVTN